ncbi:ABC transporter permease [Natronoarchaeum rubrum]|uniref:ABC transporter permease n=1 Tax=Natronoarchaeum rubrum TaxID=755311 RepID=UPI0021114FDC|nr:ABC transporter permease [Natronoarchaeum rubrum]
MSATDIDAEAPTGNTFAGDVFVNFRRWNRKVVRSPTAFVVEIVVGALSLLLFATVFGDVGEIALERAGFTGVDYVTYLLPAVLLQATIGSSFNSGMGLVGDLESGMFEKTVASPMSWTAVLAGKSASELLRIVVQVLVVLGFGVAAGATVRTGLAGVVGVVGICLLVAGLFVSIANAIGVVTGDEEVVNAATMLFMFPLLFLSPAFIPMTDGVETLATFNPVTYGVDAIRALVLGEDVMTVLEVTRFGGIYDTLVPAVGVLVALNLISGTIAVSLLARASSASAT